MRSCRLFWCVSVYVALRDSLGKEYAPCGVLGAYLYQNKEPIHVDLQKKFCCDIAAGTLSLFIVSTTLTSRLVLSAFLDSGYCAS